MAATKTMTKKSSKTKAKAKTGAVRVNSVTPFLWYDKDAEEAARFYVSLIQGSKVVSATPMSVEFKLAGQDFYALNGGPIYKPTPAFSIFVSVDTQDQVDRLWAALTAEGKADRCGWLVDKYGVSWQIIPKRLTQLLFHRDPKVAQRATEAMLKMDKIDITALNAAANGARAR